MGRDGETLRRILGLDELAANVAQLVDIPKRIKRMEKDMATAKEQLNTLSAKVDDLVADVRAAKQALEADRENLSPDGQQALDELSAKLDAFDAEVGDADGSDTPTQPVTPVEGEGAPVGGDVPDAPTDVDTTGDTQSFR